MLNFLKNTLKNENTLKGCVLIDEIVPYFSDAIGTTNKTIYILKKIMNENKGIFKDTYSDKVKTFSQTQLITQNNKLVKIKNFKFDGKLDNTFSKEGYKVGQVYELKNLGFLGNIDSTMVVKWVLDKYVVFESDNNIYLKTYEELKRSNVQAL